MLTATIFLAVLSFSGRASCSSWLKACGAAELAAEPVVEPAGLESTEHPVRARATTAAASCRST